jgi:predicted small lipoprotein YifL
MVRATTMKELGSVSCLINRRRMALALVLAAPLALAGCGRKGPLEPPPSAMPTPGGAIIPGGGAPGVSGSGDKPETPRAPRPFVLDGLLN